MKTKYLRGTTSTALALILLGAPQPAFAQETTTQPPEEEPAESTTALETSVRTGNDLEERAGRPAALGTIVVTARRVEENLMEVPLPITSLNSDELTEGNISDLATLSLYTPGLTVDRGTSSLSRQLTFRGLSQASGQIFIDGAPYTGPSNLYLGDLERVEVLVGPQSAYFGRATFTGALNYVTREPSANFGIMASADYATRNDYNISASIEGGTEDGRLTARLSGQHSYRDGHWRSSTDLGYKMGTVEQSSASLTVNAEPTDNLTFRANVIYNVEDSNNPAVINLIGDNPNPNVVRSLFCDLGGINNGKPAFWHCGALPTVSEIDQSIISSNSALTPFQQEVFFGDFPWSFQNNPLTITRFDRRFKQEGGLKRELWGGTLRGDLDFAGDWTASYLGAYFRTKGQGIQYFHYRDERGLVPNPLHDPANFPPNCTPNAFACGVNEFVGIGPLLSQQVQTDMSHEVRITSPSSAPLRGTLGASWLLSKSPGNTNTGFVPPIFGVITCCPTATRDSTPAVFGGLYYDLTDNLTIGAEARYQWDKLTRTPQLSRPGGGALQAVPAPSYGNTWTSFSPRITIDYTIGDHLLYALWSRGYRPGGFNNTLVNSPPAVVDQLRALFNADVVFEQEKLDNYEFGVKSTMLDGRLRVILGAYYQQWREGQINNSVVLVGTGGSIDNFNLVLNVGAVDLYGVEGSLSWLVTDKFELNATINYQTSDIKEYVYTPFGIYIQNSTNVEGNRFPGAPDWTWTVSPQYQDQLSGDWDWFARVDWRHKGKNFVDPTNVAWIGSHDLFDASIGIENESFRLTLYGTNLTDDDHFVQAAAQFQDQLCCATPTGIASTNVNAITVSLPFRRQFGVRFRYRY